MNDDGLQVVDEVEREARINYYINNNIGWVSRPKHGHNGYVRQGKFKKASNMNFALDISNKTEDVLREIIIDYERERGFSTEEEISEEEEEMLYDRALQKVVDETNGIAWAGGNIRIGEHILIIDSDTRVVSDHFTSLAFLSFRLSILLLSSDL